MKIELNKNTTVISVTAGIVAVVLIALMFIQFRSVTESQKAGVEGLREDELKAQIASYKSRSEEAEEQYKDNMNKIKEYETAETEEEKSKALLEEELEQSRTLLGLTDVTGEGVIITLKDQDYNVYTSENLRNLINELKYAGAEAISINDNRIINLTDIVTINNSFIVMYGDVRISSPYVVKAIGDRKYLTSTLNLKNSGFVDLMKTEGLYIDVEQSSNITIGKYNRKIEARYMKEEE